MYVVFAYDYFIIPINIHFTYGYPNISIIIHTHTRIMLTLTFDAWSGVKLNYTYMIRRAHA